MKILHVHNVLPPKMNPYTLELVTQLNQIEGVSVVGKEDLFWERGDRFDVIHIHWPEFSFEKHTLDEVKDQINFHRSRNTKLVYTRHNRGPHKRDHTKRFEKNFFKDIYDLVLCNVDGIVHHGDFSKNELLENAKTPHWQKHITIPHHISNDIKLFSKKEARETLKIPQNAFVILSFGLFRNLQETNLIKNTFNNLEIKNKFLLAPKLNIRYYTKEYPIKKFFWFLRKYYYKFLKRKTYLVDTGNVSKKMVSHHFLAADCVLIQRQNTLTSGILPTAFMYGKAVIGARTGNIPEFLEQTGNEIYKPNSEDSLLEAIYRIYDKDYLSVGQENLKYAKRNWNLEKTASTLYKFYESLLNVEQNN